MSDAKRSERSHAYLLEGAAALSPMLPRVPPQAFPFFRMERSRKVCGTEEYSRTFQGPARDQPQRRRRGHAGGAKIWAQWLAILAAWPRQFTAARLKPSAPPKDRAAQSVTGRDLPRLTAEQASAPPTLGRPHLALRRPWGCAVGWPSKQSLSRWHHRGWHQRREIARKTAYPVGHACSPARKRDGRARVRFARPRNC